MACVWQVHGMGAWWEEGCGWEVDGRWMVAPLPLHLRDALREFERHVVHLRVVRVWREAQQVWLSEQARLAAQVGSAARVS